MKLLVGLGNPGRQYEQTRHNVGFMTAAKLASMIGAGTSRTKFEGEWAEGNQGGQRLGVLCPQTYMNASGRSVRKAVDFFKLGTDDLLVICDDLDLETGRMRLKASGSAGGQKGLADIIRHLETEQFPRLRIGIGRPPRGWETADYVLGRFDGSEQPEIERAITVAASAALDWATQGVAYAMNRYNAAATQQAAGNSSPTKRSASPRDRASQVDPGSGQPPQRTDNEHES